MSDCRDLILTVKVSVNLGNDLAQSILALQVENVVGSSNDLGCVPGESVVIGFSIELFLDPVENFLGGFTNVLGIVPGDSTNDWLFFSVLFEVDADCQDEENCEKDKIF